MKYNLTFSRGILCFHRSRDERDVEIKQLLLIIITK